MNAVSDSMSLPGITPIFLRLIASLYTFICTAPKMHWLAITVMQPDLTSFCIARKFFSFIFASLFGTPTGACPRPVPSITSPLYFCFL